eukprot:scaffold12588_cov15-Tisochrysis_lutea.AAC.1
MRLQAWDILLQPCTASPTAAPLLNRAKQEQCMPGVCDFQGPERGNNGYNGIVAFKFIGCT